MAININHPFDKIIPSTESIKVSANGALKLPAGSTSARPVSAETGFIRWNTTENRLEVFEVSAWNRVATGDGIVTSVTISGDSNFVISNPTVTSAGTIDISLAPSVLIETLEVTGTAKFHTLQVSSNVVSVIESEGSALDFAVGEEVQFTLLSGNRAGFNTVTPTEVLEVFGTSKFQHVEITVDGQTYFLPTSAGTAGQVLTTGGDDSTLYWSDVSAGAGSGITEASADSKYAQLSTDNTFTGKITTSSLSVGNGGTISSTDVNIAPDIYMTGGGVLVTDLNMYFSIDANDDQVDAQYIWGHDSTSATAISANKLMSLNESGHLFVESRVGIGKNPNTYELEITSDSNPTLMITTSGNPANSNLRIWNQAVNWSRIYQQTDSTASVTSSFLDFESHPLDGVSNANIRFWRFTNTTGNKGIYLHKGDGTTDTSGVIGVDGLDTYFNVDGGNVGIGTSAPSEKFHVVGDSLYEGNITFDATNERGIGFFGSTGNYRIVFRENFDDISQPTVSAPQSIGVSIESDSFVGLVESDASAMRGFFDLNSDAFVWGGTVSIGDDTASQKLRVFEDGNSNTIFFGNTNGSFSNNLQTLRATRTASTAYNFAVYQSNDGSDNEFVFRGDGNAFADGSWGSPAADYAEMFEWEDGNPGDEDRVGYAVSFSTSAPGFIKIAQPGDNILGVVTGAPSVVGNSPINWPEKYLKDEYGREVIDVSGNPILNPEYDPEQHYVPRLDRSEWAPVGIIGRLRVRDGQPIGAGWVKIQQVTSAVSEWLIGSGSNTNARKVISIGSDYTTTQDDENILVDTSTNPVTITLATLTGGNGKTLIIKDKNNASSNNITITPESGNIDGDANLVINNDKESVTLLHDGSDWWIY